MAQSALSDGVAAEAVPGSDDRTARDGGVDGSGAGGAGPAASAGDGAPRRVTRVRVQAPAVSSAAPAALEMAAHVAADESELRKPSCTLAQMRRFIKSRPYVPVHELRRRFLIEGDEDDVNAVRTERGVVYVGLPAYEAQFLADLIRAGEVGCELLLDPTSPAVVGVYAMRPVSRQ
jgi:hypothetical protein